MGAMKVPVVDDEQAVRESLRRSLKFNGYDVILAEDGIQALEMIRNERPDLIILDVMMPRLDGLGVRRGLRSTGYDKPIPMLTARVGLQSGSPVSTLADGVPLRPGRSSLVRGGIAALVGAGVFTAVGTTAALYYFVVFSAMEEHELSALGSADSCPDGFRTY